MLIINQLLLRKLFLAVFFITCSYFASSQCVINANLNTWQQKGNPNNGTWNVNPAGTTVIQTTNGQSTYFVTPFDLINVEVTGEFRSTDADDDWIGFVFGFRDPLGTNYNDYDMLLFDWKQDIQGCNPRGMSLVRVLGNIPTNQEGNTFGCHNSTPEFNILADDFGGIGWVRNQWHQFRLIYTFTRVIIYVDNVLKFDVQGCFLPGRFGFYNRSQRNTEYRNFSYRLDIDFDFSAIAFCPNSNVQFNFIPNCVDVSTFNFNTIQSMNWNFGDGNQFNNSNVNASNVNPIHQYSAPGTYQVSLTLTDALGCSSTETRQVIINQNPVANFSIPNGCINNPVVVNNTSTSSVAITNALWNMGNGNTANGISPNGFNYNSSGNYTVELIVTDANGCTASTSRNTEIITQIDAVINSVDANCPNINDGAASVVNVSNGTAPFSYLWSNNEATQSIQNLPPSNYSVIITDANGCTGNHSALVGVNNSVPLQYSFDVSDYNGFNVSCNGFNDGMATVNVINGSAPYSYSWQNNIQNESVQNLTAGSYTVTIVDANSCSVEATVLLIEPEELTVTLSVGSNYNGVAITCFGASDGIASAQASGGAGTYVYTWSNAENSSSINGLVAGSYSVIATDINGCTTTGNIIIEQPDPVQVSIIAKEYVGLHNISCNGGTDGEINASVSGGVLPFSYSWNNGESSGNIQNLSEGNYSLTVLDANGCEATASITLNEPASLLVILQGENLICYGDNDGVINANVSGGTSAYNYNWSNNASGATITNLVAGNYSVTITDANNCSLSESYTINQPEPVTVSIQPVSDTIPFFGANLQLTSVYFANGNEASLFEWTPENNLSNPNTQNPIANPLYTTTYTLRVTDTDGCTGTDSIKVFVNNDKVLYIPNAFSPNGDGENDIFKIYTYNNSIRKLTFQIHNRWGELVFQTSDINEGWDGTKNGKSLDAGVYVYTVHIIYLDGDPYKKQGSVTLIK